MLVLLVALGTALVSGKTVDSVVDSLESQGLKEIRLSQNRHGAGVRDVPARVAQDSPRARCEITSILFDWVFDGPINRIVKGDDVITIEA